MGVGRRAYITSVRALLKWVVSRQGAGDTIRFCIGRQRCFYLGGQKRSATFYCQARPNTTLGLAGLARAPLRQTPWSQCIFARLVHVERKQPHILSSHRQHSMLNCSSEQLKQAQSSKHRELLLKLLQVHGLVLTVCAIIVPLRL